MRWLIDGYNVIRRDAELAGIDRRSLEEGRDALLRLLARQGGAGTTVVTSDRSVQAAANRVHAAVVGAEAFLDRVAAPEAAAAEDDDDTPDRPEPKKGNPRRRSREERRSQRALDRLRPRRP